MCSIIISIDLEEARELVKLNSSRGSHSYSVTVFDSLIGEIKSCIKGLGKLDPNSLTLNKNEVLIIHQQAPTTQERNEKFIHPSIIDVTGTSWEYLGVVGKQYLWHNGIIKTDECTRLKEELKNTSYLDKELEGWDTHLLHAYFLYTVTFDGIDGSFAIAMVFDDNIYVARNDLAPLYKGDYSISSTQFPGSEMIEAGQLYNVDVDYGGKLVIFADPYSSFKTVHNPYYFGD